MDVRTDVLIILFRTTLLLSVCLLLSACFHSSNHPPTANAGTNQIAPQLGSIITLDGSLSSDVDGDNLTFAWEIMERPAGSSAELSDPTAEKPTLLIDQNGNFLIRLIVSDGSKQSKADFIRIFGANLKPQALYSMTAPTQGNSYIAGDKVEFDASQSVDPESQTLFYHWEIIVKPDGSQSEFNNNSSVSPFLVVDLAGTYIVHLVVDDGVNKSPFATIPFNVISANDPPVAIARDVSDSNGKNYVAGSTLRLDGTGSYDPEGQALLYRWLIAEKPANSLSQLITENGATTSFKTDFSGRYIVHLYVDDGVHQSKNAVVIFEVEEPVRLTDTRPFAEAGKDQPLYGANVLIQLDGTASYDIENDPLSYRWEMLTKPEGSFAVLSDLSSPKPFFTADILGSYVIQLIVSDINGDSHLDSVVVTPHAEPELACGDCHNNEITRGKAADHLLNYDDCAACHFSDTFSPTKGSFHAHGHKARPSQCEVCHDGVIASTKHVEHMTTDKDCNFCHLLSNGTWVPALRVPGNPGFTHNGIFSLCGDCHDNQIQKGKPEGHMPASSRCNACHAVNAWSPARHLEHTQALGACKNCHDPDQDKRVQPDNHLKTSNNCLACHTEDTWIPVLRVDHNETIGSCASCHEKPIGHIDSSTFCDKCHNTFKWADTVLAHDFFTGACIECHNGVVSTGAPDSHVLMTEVCESCHNEINWIPNVVDHLQVLGECASCHDQMGNRFNGKPHMTTTSKCDACHGTVVWSPATTVDHVEVIGQCVDCHNNVLARWKPVLHVNSDNTCEACHGVKSFLPALEVDHNVVSGLCSDCHNSKIAVDKSLTHFQTTRSCENCHATTQFSAVITVDHNELQGACVSCHDGTVSSGKGFNHIASSDECEFCHNTDAILPVRMDHEYGIGTCASCHNGSVALGKPVSHLDTIAYPTPDVCEHCHNDYFWNLKALPAGHEAEVANCARSGCHDNSETTGQHKIHISASQACEACHTSSAFSPIAEMDHSQVDGICSDCHDGISAKGQASSHIATSVECEACHAPTWWIPTINVDHKALFGDCFSCHNGTDAPGKSVTHRPSDNNCENCHDNFSWSKLTAFGHFLLSPTTCSSSGCHTIGVPHTSVVVEDCSSCHIVASWLNWARPTTQRAP